MRWLLLGDLSHCWLLPPSKNLEKCYGSVSWRRGLCPVRGWFVLFSFFNFYYTLGFVLDVSLPQFTGYSQNPKGKCPASRRCLCSVSSSNSLISEPSADHVSAVTVFEHHVSSLVGTCLLRAVFYVAFWPNREAIPRW